jgi:predicted phosphohydrolase
MSDLHLEHRIFYKINKIPDCTGLILAGDIGDPATPEYKEFVNQASYLFNDVFLIYGNHECHGRSVSEATKLIQEIVSELPNIHFLNNSSYDIENVRFVGSTLWTHIEDEQRHDISTFVSDFISIRDWYVEKHNYLHDKSVAFIKKEVIRAKIDKKNVIVITHHAPFINTDAHRHSGSILSSAYETDLSDIIHSPISVWVHGHTHCRDVNLNDGIKRINCCVDANNYFPFELV